VSSVAEITPSLMNGAVTMLDRTDELELSCAALQAALQ
jgi:hypothetical protein